MNMKGVAWSSFKPLMNLIQMIFIPIFKYTVDKLIVA